MSVPDYVNILEVQLFKIPVLYAAPPVEISRPFPVWRTTQDIGVELNRFECSWKKENIDDFFADYCIQLRWNTNYQASKTRTEWWYHLFSTGTTEHSNTFAFVEPLCKWNRRQEPLFITNTTKPLLNKSRKLVKPTNNCDQKWWSRDVHLKTVPSWSCKYSRIYLKPINNDAYTVRLTERLCQKLYRNTVFHDSSFALCCWPEIEVQRNIIRLSYVSRWKLVERTLINSNDRKRSLLINRLWKQSQPLEKTGGFGSYQRVLFWKSIVLFALISARNELEGRQNSFLKSTVKTYYCY